MRLVVSSTNHGMFLKILNDNRKLMMKKNLVSNLTTSLILFTMSANIAYADIASGMASANTQMTIFQKGLYTLLGVFSIVYLIYLAVMAKTDKKTWGDFGWGIVHVCIVGAVVAIATWAFTAFA